MKNFMRRVLGKDYVGKEVEMEVNEGFPPKIVSGTGGIGSVVSCESRNYCFHFRVEEITEYDEYRIFRGPITKILK